MRTLITAGLLAWCLATACGARTAVTIDDPATTGGGANEGAGTGAGAATGSGASTGSGNSGPTGSGLGGAVTSSTTGAGVGGATGTGSVGTGGVATTTTGGTSTGGPTTGGTGGGPVMGASCRIDSDCKLVDDCCQCEAVSSRSNAPACAARCDVTRCEAQQIHGVRCLRERCTLAPECDTSTVTCKAIPPSCPERGFVPSISGNCWSGKCVEAPACRSVRGCPDCDDGFHICGRNPTNEGLLTQCFFPPRECVTNRSCGCAGRFICAAPNEGCVADVNASVHLTCGPPQCPPLVGYCATHRCGPRDWSTAQKPDAWCAGHTSVTLYENCGGYNLAYAVKSNQPIDYYFYDQAGGALLGIGFTDGRDISCISGSTPPKYPNPPGSPTSCIPTTLPALCGQDASTSF